MNVIDVLVYVAPPVVVGIICYVAGYEACERKYRRVNDGTAEDQTAWNTLNELSDEHLRTIGLNAGEISLIRSRGRRKGLDLGVIGYLLAALALVVAGFTAYQGQAQDRARVACFNTYANQVADALDARQRPSQERDHAITHVFDVVSRLFDGTATQAEFKVSVEQYLAANSRLEHQRVVSPYPEPPRAVCSS